MWAAVEEMRYPSVRRESQQAFKSKIMKTNVIRTIIHMMIELYILISTIG